jgi:hypothetical protein
VLVFVPLMMLSGVEGFNLRWIWYLSVASVGVQLTISLLLLRREFGRRLKFDDSPAPLAPAMAPADV